MTVEELVAESNLIEGITREPTADEVEAFEDLLLLDEITVGDLCNFVRVYEPQAYLRDKIGEDVRIDNHFPPPGGPKIRSDLKALLRRVGHFVAPEDQAFYTYIEFEQLHPFIDCNGRVGRALWFWMMSWDEIWMQIGFLRTFHIQAHRYFNGIKDFMDELKEAQDND